MIQDCEGEYGVVSVMTRESSHEKFPAQVLTELAAFRPFRTHDKDGHLHFCFDKKIKQNAFNNLIMSGTPYRCSLGKTRPKEAKPKRTKRANEDRIRTDEELSSACLSLPKIPSAAELIRRKHECSKTSVAKNDSSELESDEEHHCDFLSCGSLKIEEQVGDSVQSARETTRESRSRSLPLILNRENTSSCLKCNTRACKFRLQTRESYPPRPSVGSDLCYLRDNSLIDQDFTKVMEDGSRVTVKQRRLFIEIFMPRTS